VFADRRAAVYHLGAAEHFDFQPVAPAAPAQNAVDQPFHGHPAIAGRRRDGIVSAGRFGQQKMIHAAQPQGRITNAGGDTGTERGHQHFVRTLRDLVFA
jgi:hypothetical protein